jgi:tRNA (guanine-N(7)-)-methyltransferase subunit TRM82
MLNDDRRDIATTNTADDGAGIMKTTPLEEEILSGEPKDAADAERRKAAATAELQKIVELELGPRIPAAARERLDAEAMGGKGKRGRECEGNGRDGGNDGTEFGNRGKGRQPRGSGDGTQSIAPRALTALFETPGEVGEGDDDNDDVGESESESESEEYEEETTYETLAGLAYGSKLEIRRWTATTTTTTASEEEEDEDMEGDGEDDGDLDSDSDAAYGGYASSSSEDEVQRMKRLQNRDLGSCEIIKLSDDDKPHTGTIRVFRTSPDGKWFVTGGDDKLIKLWNVNGWKCVRTIARGKKIFSACFTPDSAHLLFADKFGEIHAVAVGSDADPVLVLAHCSTIITDVECMESGRTGYILSGDREHKTRVSVLPKPDDRTAFEGSAPEIQSFCYGHDEYISCIRPVCQRPKMTKSWNSKNTFITGGGDSVVRMWDADTGKETDPKGCIEFHDGEIYDIATRREGTHVAVAVEGRKTPAVVHLTAFRGTPKLFMVGFGPKWAEQPESIKFDKNMVLWGGGVRENADGSRTAVFMREGKVIDGLSITLGAEESGGTTMSTQLKKKVFSEQERSDRKKNRLDVRISSEKNRAES